MREVHVTGPRCMCAAGQRSLGRSPRGRRGDRGGLRPPAAPVSPVAGGSGCGGPTCGI